MTTETRSDRLLAWVTSDRVYPFALAVVLVIFGGAFVLGLVF